MTTREQAWQALFALLSAPQGPVNKAGVFSFSRVMMLPGSIKEQPAFANAGGKLPILILREEDEGTIDNPGTPANREWMGWIIVYFIKLDQKVAGATIINPIIDAIEQVLTPVGRDAMLGRFTLSQTGSQQEVVYHCRISGTTVKETGDTDPQGMGGCAIPILMRVP